MPKVPVKFLPIDYSFTYNSVLLFRLQLLPYLMLDGNLAIDGRFRGVSATPGTETLDLSTNGNPTCLLDMLEADLGT